MKFKLLMLATVATLGLAACDSQPQTSVAPESMASTAAATTTDSTPVSTPTPPEAQVLTSRDNAVSISVKGNFQDQINNPDFLPEGVTAQDITLLQQDVNRDIVAYIVNLGKPAKPAKEYYAQLKQQLEKASDLQDVKIGIATENRMDYSFTQDNGLQENCIAIYSPDNLYNVCANSHTASNSQLIDVLKDVKLLKPI